MGNCGVGFAPVKPDKHEWLIDLMEGVEDIPGTALHEGITWGWESFPEYLDVIAGMPHAIDIGAQVPHAALRGYVMGDRGADHRRDPDSRRDRADGPAGRRGHRGRRPRVQHLEDRGPQVGGRAAHPEPHRHRRRAARHRPGHRGDGQGRLRGRRRPRRPRSRVRPAAGHGRGQRAAAVDHHPATPRLSLRRVHPDPSAHRAGRGRRDPAPGPGGGPPGRRHHEPRGTDQPVAALGHLRPTGRTAPRRARWSSCAKADTRRAILAELAAEPAGTTPLDRFPYTFVLGDPARYDQTPDESIAAQARRNGSSAAEIAYDVLLANGGTGVLYVPVVNFVDADFQAVREMLVHPLTVPGLGDAGAHCTMICDASFPTYLLSYWGVSAAPDQRLPLEWIIKSQCADTAALVGLNDRGVLAAGLPGRRQPHRPRRPGDRHPGDALRPAGRAASDSSSGPAATWPRSSPERSSPGTVRRPAPCPAFSSGAQPAPLPPRPASGRSPSFRPLHEEQP